MTPGVVALAAAVSWQNVTSIRDAAEEAVTQLHPGAQVEAAIDEHIRMPACSRPLSASAKLSGNASATATVRCEGKQRWQLYVPVRLSSQVRVLVLSRPKARGDVITTADLKTEMRPRATLAYGFFTDAAALQGKSLKRSLGAGTIPGPGDIDDDRRLRPGAPVTLISRISGIEVRMDGRVLTARSPDSISVENLSSGRKVNGRMIGPNTVEVLP